MASLVGLRGEELATNYLQSNHFKILDRNFRAHGGEIDIVCQKNDVLIFVEVKARVGERKGKPYEAVTATKLSRLKKAIGFYLLKNQNHPPKLRIDVISILFRSDLSIQELKHFENVEM